MPAPGSPGLTVWLTGLPGSGKTTTATGLAARCAMHGVPAFILDGDVLRQGLNADLDFSKEDRFEAVRRAGETALLLAKTGVLVVVSLVSPYSEARAKVRRRHRDAGVGFVEVWLSAPLEVCEARDPKQLYLRARASELSMMTGVNDPYEPPLEPDVELPTHLLDAEAAVAFLADVVQGAWDQRASG